MQTREIFIIKEIINDLEIKIRDLQKVNKRVYLNKCIFIVSKILWKMVTQTKDYNRNGVAIRIHANNEECRINKDLHYGTLSFYFGGEVKKISNMMLTLQEWGIIEVFKKEVKGESARKYKLCEKYAKCKISLQSLKKSDGAYAKKFIEGYKPNHELEDYVLSILNQHLSINEDGFNYLLDKYNDYRVMHHAVEAHRKGWFDDNKTAIVESLNTISFDPIDIALVLIFKKKYYANINPKNGRLDHNLTNLKSQHRDYLLLDGKPMDSTDISNSQPTFAIPLINQKLKELNSSASFICEDMLRYEEYCKTCQFYEVIAKEANIDIATREERSRFKDLFYSQLKYCENNNWKTPIQEAYKKLFPNAYRAIWEIKRNDYAQFAVKVQKLESDLMINSVYKKLAEESHIALPLHDAIYSSNQGTFECAKHLIKTSFKEMYGITISFKDE